MSAGLLRQASDLHDVTVLGGGARTTRLVGGDGRRQRADPDDRATQPPTPTTAPPPPTTAPPAGPVATTYSGYAGQALGTGSKTLVIIGTGSGAASTLFTNLQADPLVDTHVVWLNSGDVTATADVDAIVASGADYLVAAPVGEHHRHGERWRTRSSAPTWRRTSTGPTSSGGSTARASRPTSQLQSHL